MPEQVTAGAGPPTPPERSMLRVVFGVLYVLAALLASAAVLFMTVFAVSPTTCPATGGSILCTTSYGSLLVLAGVGVLLVLFVGLAVGVSVARTGRRALVMFAGSLAALVLAVLVAAAAATSWS